MDWTEQSEQDLRRLSQSQQREALEKESLILRNPMVGAHKDRELYCKRSLNIDNLRLVYVLRPFEHRAVIITVDAHDSAYDKALDWQGVFDRRNPGA
ncbi:MAG: hypothetical protein AAB152_06815 [Candidatus Coatesbacteria bacterium]